jgi:hypothetical protein
MTDTGNNVEEVMHRETNLRGVLNKGKSLIKAQKKKNRPTRKMTALLLWGQLLS